MLPTDNEQFQALIKSLQNGEFRPQDLGYLSAIVQAITHPFYTSAQPQIQSLIDSLIPVDPSLGYEQGIEKLKTELFGMLHKQLMLINEVLTTEQLDQQRKKDFAKATQIALVSLDSIITKLPLENEVSLLIQAKILEMMDVVRWYL